MGSYIATTDSERRQMLETIGISSMDELFADIPEAVRIKGELKLPPGCSELEVDRKMKAMAGKNTVFPTIFRGAGAYRHYIPAIVDSVTGKEEFLTAYTPYQAEISQGILQSIFEYQTMICELTGMDASNASVYDGASAAAEGIAMCRERKKNTALVSETVHPDTMEVIRTYCHGNGIELITVGEKNGVTDVEALEKALSEQTMCVYIQHPNYYGNLEPAAAIGELVHEVKGKLVMGVNPISLGVLKTPREYGADVAVGEGQPLGMPLSFGGPYLGFMTCTSDMARKLPGRIVGETVDHKGERAYVLTLQAREQHIRREKASSNICSNQALCAMRAAVYLAAMGRDGLKQAAGLSMSKAHYLAAELEKIGYHRTCGGEFFHEFVTTAPEDIAGVLGRLEERGILGGYPLTGSHEGELLWCCTELNTKDEIDALIETLGR